MENLVEIKNLTKSYGPFVALKDVSMSLPKGKVIGLLGPNGSGKTTTIKILTNLLMNYSGEVLIDGNKPGIYTKGIISYLPDRNFLADKWTINYAIEYFGDFFSDFDKEKAQRLISNFGINLNKTFKSLSKGMKEKVQLSLVLSRKAKLYIFDEPIAGVDPAARDVIFKLILNHCSPESTIIISTHLVSEVEEILDDVIFLKNGEVIYNGTKTDLMDKYEGKSVNDIFREVYRYEGII
ncbi:MAG: ABC transporter ATP-binding protein [Bacilli bacterium]|nr:ABC transporter ATP-binding protein [Bacilli bacterium]